LWQGSSRPTRNDLKISTEGGSAEAPVPLADVGMGVELFGPFIELCADCTTVEALENVLLVMFRVAAKFEFPDAAELGGSRALGGVFVGAGRQALTSSG
jgi:hypothetical protein